MTKKYILNGTYEFNKKIYASKVEVNDSEVIFTTEDGTWHYPKEHVDFVVEVTEIYKREETK